MARAMPEIVACRLTVAEKAVVALAAEMEGIPVSELIRRSIVPKAKRRVLREGTPHSAPRVDR